MRDEVLYQSKPSNWINVHWLLITIVTFLLVQFFAVIPLIVYLYKMFDIDRWNYTFTEESFYEERGPFNMVLDEVLYFRVKDVRLETPFLMSFVGLSNLYIISSDKLRPVIKLVGIKDGLELRDAIKEIVIEKREINGVKEYDLR